MSYDIFISYRRKGAGAGVAGELQTKFENRGYKVFLDVDNIGSGDFPEQIDNAIKGCNDFLLILSVGMLDRCVDEEDWVRHEIVLAEKYGKNIIGVSLPGFVMPEVNQLPEPLRDIPEKQVFLWSHEYRNASIDKIENNLISSSKKKKRSHRKLSIGIVGGVLLAVGAWLLLSRPKPEVPPEEPIVVEEEDPSKGIRDSYAQFVDAGDDLLRSIQNPTNEEEYRHFMEAFASYGEALKVARMHPEIELDSSALSHRYDSLNVLRRERFQFQLNAAKSFLIAEEVDLATHSYNIAKVLAVEEDQQQLEAVARKIKK
ncbi:MAG: toll/interleukin-1 receptor domain-containing protein [Bacteroidales bacterium]|nr:toll/interleukin-1 receptor domain-containing protein [Bacteroidales bacterium]